MLAVRLERRRRHGGLLLFGEHRLASEPGLGVWKILVGARADLLAVHVRVLYAAVAPGRVDVRPRAAARVVAAGLVGAQDEERPALGGRVQFLEGRVAAGLVLVQPVAGDPFVRPLARGDVGQAGEEGLALHFNDLRLLLRCLTYRALEKHDELPPVPAETLGEGEDVDVMG